MRVAIQILILLAVTALTSCCSRSDEPRVRPTLSTDHLEMVVGDERAVEVSGCETVRAEAEGDIIEAHTEGLRVVVRALGAGTASVTIYADGVMLRCRVTVEERVTPPEGETPPQEPTDDDEQLGDASWRYVSASSTLRYDEPGTIFSVNRRSGTYGVRSLTTGESMTVNPGRGELTVNGESVEVESAEIVAQDDNALWIKIKTQRWRHTIWLVTRP